MGKTAVRKQFDWFREQCGQKGSKGKGGRGKAVSEKNFSAFGHQFGLKIRGAVPPPGPLPYSRH